jgi:hypothetical protein
MDNKYENNNSANNSGASGNQDSQGMDWRERRYECRMQMREARRRDPLRGLFFGLLLIMGGGLFLAVQMGGLDGDKVWKYFLVGLGAIFIIDGLVHFNHPEFPFAVYGKFIVGAVLLLTGILFVFELSTIWWPVVLIAAGCAFLIRLGLRRTSSVHNDNIK